MLRVIPLQQQALLAGDVQRIAGGGDGIEVKALRVVGAVLERRPVLAAVLGAQDQVEHPDHITQLVVGEPDIEQGFVGPLRHQALAFGDQQRPLFVAGFCTGQRLVMLDQQGPDLAAVQLLAPGRTRVVAVQDHAVAAHRPTLGGRRKTHGIEVGTDRHGGLLPVIAGVIGIQNVATLSDGNQSVAGPGHAR
ncbi:hypothetical protein D3C87_1537510 [compost metagenome]